MNFADPKSNVLQLGLREGMKVADLGAGSGHYTLAAAGIVGADGKVYAVDVQEDVLKHALDTAHRMGLRNIDAIWGDIERVGGTKLREHSMDAVIISNVLFQIEHMDAFIQEIRRIPARS
jgi:ubiquinone/menaquinone biosynthesis C-methylase UbiE